MTNIVVEEGNTVYDSRSNCNAIIETSSDTLIKGCSNTIIPEGVKIIGDSALSYCDFTSIIIPEGVTRIGNGAFNCCRSLTDIQIPDSLVSIGENAFAECNLTSLRIPADLQSIGNNAFVMGGVSMVIIDSSTIAGDLSGTGTTVCG